MKKILLTAVALAVALGAAGSASASYMITPDSAFPRIGGTIFQLHGMNITHANGHVTFDIYTNYLPGASAATVGTWETFAGDLFFDFNGDGNYDHGVVFTDKEGLTPGAFYEISTLKYSDDYVPTDGRYRYDYHKNRPVAIGAGHHVVDAISFVHEAIGSDPKYRWQIVLDDSYFPFGVDIGLFYPVASCANHFLEGDFSVVPEPATMLLFGTGLAGFGVLKRKKFNI